ncbi:hypothetical protein MTO96_032666 [Rhipicephalus appendiculatus]
MVFLRCSLLLLTIGAYLNACTRTTLENVHIDIVPYVRHTAAAKVLFGSGSMTREHKTARCFFIRAAAETTTDSPKKGGVSGIVCTKRVAPGSPCVVENASMPHGCSGGPLSVNLLSSEKRVVYYS